jgi:Yip1-like protein
MSDPEIQPADRFNPQPDPPKVMSTAQTLTSVFFEPGETFKALRERPRFLIAGLIMVVIFMAYYSTFVWRVGAEAIARAQIEQRQPDATPEQIDQGLAMQNNPIVKVITYASFPVVFAVLFAAGAGLYLLGAMLMGKSLSYKQALSVWVYSSYPPMVVYVVINIVLLFLKSADDIDPTAINSGIARANPSILVDPKAQPLLATVLGSFDLIQFYGLFLAAVGLKIVGKLSSGSAWAIVLGIWFVGLILRVVMSLIMGTAF